MSVALHHQHTQNQRDEARALWDLLLATLRKALEESGCDGEVGAGLLPLCAKAR